MRILFLSFYYRPDLCAGAFRATPLAHALSGAAPEGSMIEVVTTVPNRYASFAADAELVDDFADVTVHRVPLPAHRSGMLDQSRAFAAYARGVFRHVQGRDYDVVCATSSRLLTAALAAWVARRKRVPLYLDIRDLFADTMRDILPRPVAFGIGPLLSALERWTMQRADHVNLVSAGFADYFSTRYPGVLRTCHPNGIDAEFLSLPAPVPTAGADAQPVSVLYAGNIGEGQGLHNILPALARALGTRVRFMVIGDGGRKERLLHELERAGVSNVEVSPPLAREPLIAAYRSADVLFLHLNDHDAFRKVLPSKIFEYAALGKPIWAGVGGYAAEFIRAEVENASVFPPCDVPAAVDALARLELNHTPRTAFTAKYRRDEISRRMAYDIVALGASR